MGRCLLHSTRRLGCTVLVSLAVAVLVSLYFLHPEVAVFVPRDSEDETYMLRLELRRMLQNTTKNQAMLSSRPMLISQTELYQGQSYHDDERSVTKTETVVVHENAKQLNAASAVAPAHAILPDGGIWKEEEEEAVKSDTNSSRSLRNLLGLRGESATRDNFHANTGASVNVTRQRLKKPPRRQLHHVTHRASQGFLIATRYEQQLLGAFKGFYHLSRIATLLNLSVVEPYVQGTEMHTAPSIPKNATLKAAKLSHFYNLYGLRKALQYCTNGTDMTTFDTFLRKASRRAVFVVFLPDLKNHEHYFDGTEKKIVEVNSYTSNTLLALGRLNAWTAHLNELHKSKRERVHRYRYKTFRKSRTLLVDARPLHPVPWRELETTLESVVKEQVEQFGTTTVIVPSWRDVKPPDIVSTFFYDFPGFEHEYCKNMSLIPHSDFVVNKTRKWMKSLGTNSGPVIGVHIRAERLLKDFGNETHYLGCIEELKELLRSGSLPKVPNENIHLFHDLGKHGTQTCNRVCPEHRDAALSAIEKLGFNNLNYDPRTEPGYVVMALSLAAFVDREYLSQVDYLVTVGRGEYQDNIVNRFVHRFSHRDKLYRICNNKHPIPLCYPHCD